MNEMDKQLSKMNNDAACTMVLMKRMQDKIMETMLLSSELDIEGYNEKTKSEFNCNIREINATYEKMAKIMGGFKYAELK